MRHAFSVRIGPVGFRVGSDWRGPIAALEALYSGYPKPDIADFTVRLEAPRPWRHWLRPKVAISGDFTLPDAAPLPLAHGLLAAEMAMNLQMAIGQRQFLLLHAATVEKGGRAIVLTGESGAGKSTLAALLMARGWRLMGDEFALLSPETGMIHAFPRAISLKNDAIAVVAAAASGGRWGPMMAATPKGDIRHLCPDDRALAAIEVPALPAHLIFPRFGFESAARDVAPSEAFVRLTQASTNYVALGERGFAALTRFVTEVPATAIDYPDTASGIAAVEALA